MSTPTGEQLAEWRKVTNAATGGPWTALAEPGKVPIVGVEANPETGQDSKALAVFGGVGEKQAGRDAEFAATARTAMLLLLDEVERLTAQLDELRQGREDIAGYAIAYVNTPDHTDQVEQAWHELKAAVEHLEAVERRDVVADNPTPDPPATEPCRRCPATRAGMLADSLPCSCIVDCGTHGCEGLA